jgi:hypothetical protein
LKQLIEDYFEIGGNFFLFLKSSVAALKWIFVKPAYPQKAPFKTFTYWFI